ncbi:MAG: hypothetical protein K2O08_06340, partial [Clostridia bacterium]|nr:hypothetical protein [Clostridia bacterium]
MDIRKRRIKGIFVLSVLIILCLFIASVFSMFIPQKTTNAIISSSSVVEVEELLNTGYENYNDNSKNIFNKNNIRLLYEKLTGESGANFNTVKSLGTKTSADFRRLNDNNDIIVTLGGKKWTVTYLTQANGNVVLDLWLANIDTNTSPYNNSELHDSTDLYPSGMYSTSYIRVSTLNNGGKYKVDKDALSDDQQQNVKNNFAMFTMDNSQINTSIKKYLLTPEQVGYQANENSKDINFRVSAINNGLSRNNDAYEKVPDAVWYGDGSYCWEDKDYYGDWKSDYVWLPGSAELGAGIDESNFDGIWKTSIEQRKASSLYYLRSTMCGNCYIDIVLQNGTYSYGTGTTARGVRPAIHLNLSEVNEVSAPTDVSIDYAGKQLSLDDVPAEKKTWYDSSSIDLTYPSGMMDVGTYRVMAKIKPELQAEEIMFSGTPDTSKGETDYIRYFDFVITEKTLRADFNKTVSPPTVKAVEEDLAEKDKSLADSILKIQYTDDKGNTSFDTPSKVGTYTAKVIFNSSVTESKNYKLDKEYTDTVFIDKIPIKLPTFDPSEWYTYDSTEQTYILDYNSDEVEVTLVNDYNGAIDFDGTFITVTKAGEYKDALKAHLKRKYNATDNSGITVWDISGNSPEDQYLSFEVKKKALQFTIDSTDGVIDGRVGEALSINVRYVNNNPYGNDVVNYVINATRAGTTTTIKNLGSGSVVKNKPAESVELDMTKLRIAGDWVLSIEAEDGEGNYTVTLASAVTLKLVKAGGSTDLVWWFRVDGKDTYETVSAKVGETSVNFEPDEKKVYGKGEYSFYATAPDGYEIDENYDENGFAGGYKDTVGINAGEYRTQVRIKKTGETSGTTYEIVWSVEKAMFNLSNVKWLYDGKLPYNGGKEIEEKLDPEALPKELKA